MRSGDGVVGLHVVGWNRYEGAGLVLLTLVRALHAHVPDPARLASRALRRQGHTPTAAPLPAAATTDPHPHRVQQRRQLLQPPWGSPRPRCGWPSHPPELPLQRRGGGRRRRSGGGRPAVRRRVAGVTYMYACMCVLERRAVWAGRRDAPAAEAEALKHHDRGRHNDEGVGADAASAVAEAVRRRSCSQRPSPCHHAAAAAAAAAPPPTPPSAPASMQPPSPHTLRLYVCVCWIDSLSCACSN